MKKLLLALLTTLGFGLTTPAASFHSEQFLSGSYMILATNQTFTYGDTNIPYMNLVTSNQVYSATNSYILAMNLTNINTGYILGLTNFGSVWSNSISQFTNATGGTAVKNFDLAWKDATTWGDPNARVIPDLAFSFVLLGTNAASTNALNFTFVGLEPTGLRTPTFLANDTAVGTNNTFIIRVLTAGVGLTTYRTNIPVSFLQGAGAIRLQTINTERTTENIFPTAVMGVAIQGFVP